MVSPIRSAVFPVAGRGTRFLPATKGSPKEMFPIIDKPLIQYAVEEALAAGVKNLVFVTGSSKRAIEDHFRTDIELERFLIDSGKTDLLSAVRDIVPTGVDCIYVRQGEPLGLGHAVLCARSVVGDEPFLLHLTDDLIYSKTSCLKRMKDYYELYGCSVLAFQTVPENQTMNYGIVAIESEGSDTQRVTKIVEKPSFGEAPSNLAVVGRYVLTSKIFEHLISTERGAGNEIQLTDAIARLISDEPVHVLPIEGTRYDCGSKLGYLQATVEYGMRHPDLGPEFRAYLNSLDS